MIRNTEEELEKKKKCCKSLTGLGITVLSQTQALQLVSGLCGVRLLAFEVTFSLDIFMCLQMPPRCNL